MKDTARYIETQIQQDPGFRGLEEWAVQDKLLPAVKSLMKGDHIVIATGFYILKAQAIETDGPPGALILAQALASAGKKVSLIYDDHSDEIMRAGLKWLNAEIETVVLSPGSTADESIIKNNTTHFVALERPGKARDGLYYNFAGKDISPYHASLDELYTNCPEQGIKTLAIGDGGNELGMGCVSEAVDQFTGKNLSCITPSDYCICAGVSNWAGYGMAALLSRFTEQNLMLRPEVLNSILHSIVESGAVDGISGKAEITVDGLVSDWESRIYKSMYDLAAGEDLFQEGIAQ